MNGVKVVGNQLIVPHLDSVAFLKVRDQLQDASGVDDSMFEKGVIVTEPLSAAQKVIGYYETAHFSQIVGLHSEGPRC